MRLDHLLSKENVRCQITDVSYSKSTSDLDLMNFFTIRFSDILHLFNLQDPSGVLEELIRGHSSAGRAPALQAGGRGFDSRCLHQAGLRPAPEEN